MTNEPFLILHKVRGEPAFDIAIRLQIGDEEGWIIPTSGHRAYPVWWCELAEFDVTEMIIKTSGLIPPFTIKPNWPDHYSVNTVNDHPVFSLESLGLTKSKPAERLKRP